MRHLIPLLLCSVIPLTAAEELGTLVFSDDFSRNESQETTEDPGNDWSTNSKSRAKGNKQVDLLDGAIRIYIHAEADHSVSVAHPFEFVNGAVTMRFKLESDKDSLGLDFADLQCKEVHAGHLFKATFYANKVSLLDSKTGIMSKAIRDLKEAGTKLTADQNAMLKAKEKIFPLAISVGEWHTLIVIVKGDTLSASVDDKVVGSFSSEGFSHPTKRVLRLSVPRTIVIDDVKLYKKD